MKSAECRVISARQNKWCYLFYVFIRVIRGKKVLKNLWKNNNEIVEIQIAAGENLRIDKTNYEELWHFLILTY